MAIKTWNSGFSFKFFNSSSYILTHLGDAECISSVHISKKMIGPDSNDFKVYCRLLDWPLAIIKLIILD